MEEIAYQRRYLKGTELDAFDAQWGLDPVGEFARGEPSRIPCFRGKPGAEELIGKEVIFVSVETAKKVEKLQYATDQHSGLEILHLFIMDLLGRKTPAARIFETKAMEDFQHTQVVSKTAKRLAALGLAALNVFFVYYALLTGYRRGLSWQRMYLLACLVQFAVEILLFETMECVWINCAIPILVSSEVRRVGDDIVEVVHQMCSGEKLESQYFLNAPDYLFVSTNIAKKFPQLMESIVVRMYTNHLPGEMAKIWQVGSVARINRHERIRRATVLGGVIALLQYLGTAPFVLHRMFIRFSQPFVFSAVVLFWQMVVDNQLYVIIAASVFGGFGFYCAYMYYVDKYMNSNIRGVAPVSAEYEGELPIASPSRATQPAPGLTPASQSASQLSQVNAARAISRVGVYDSDTVVIPVLDQNFEAVPTRRPFGSSKGSSESGATSSKPYKKRSDPVSKSKKESSGGKANPTGANVSGKVKTAQKESASKTPVKVASYEDSSALSSEDLPSELDKPSKRKKAKTDSDRGRSKELSTSKHGGGSRSRDRGGKKDHRRDKAGKHGKQSSKGRGRKRTSSDMSVESIPEGEEEESEVSELSEREEQPHRSKSSKQASRKDAKTKSKPAEKSKSKSKNKKKGEERSSKSMRRRKRVPSSDSEEEEDSGSSDGHRFSHSDSSDTSSSDSH
jgi:Ca2+/Na+ antiporter